MKKKTAKNSLTELVFILDKSGSMAPLAADTVGGFNTMLAQQREVEGDALVTTVLFSSETELLHDRLPLADVAPLTGKDYRPLGCTALLDAIGETVERVALIQKHQRPEDRPARTLVAITTDGMENASRRFGSDRVKRMIKEKEDEGWEFLFLAANIDAVETAERIGIRADRAANYSATEDGTERLFHTVGNAFKYMRCMDDMELPEDWADSLDGDEEE